ncbi:M16 family metallopeptidase [Mucilaginibacter sp. dw_454]|uniref:M16 family metallopeptidase n=1 Tax=Mucilaginibacter sp. dw_454 TaxID=2720079 RepID=UPI001BD4A71A|nr:M16 family metallopeptidase [Mucilaginibacter sp. dw_454]
MNFKSTFFLAAAALLFSTGNVVAQVKKKTTTAHKPAATASAAKPGAKTNDPNVLPIDPNVIMGKLPNGLTYYIRGNAQPKGKAQLLLVNKVGSVLESDAQRGMALLVEHMAFRGTRDFSKKQLDNYLSKLGDRYGADTSAFTSFDETTYQLTVPTDTAKVFADGFNILANWAAHVSFDPTALNEEKNILIAQAAAGGKSPEDRLQQETLPTLLNNSRYGSRLPAGTEATLKAIDVNAAKSFYTDWYRPNLQAVIAVGDFDPKKVEEMIKFSFASLRNPAPEKPQPQFAVPATPGTTIKLATDKGFPYTFIQIIVKHPQAIVKTPADVLQNIRINLFNQMINNRIADLSKIPSPPIKYGQSGYAEFIGKQDAFSTIALAKTPQDLESTFKAVLAETERARKFGFTLTELERAKQNALGQVTTAYSAKDSSPSASFATEYDRSFLSKQAIPGIDYEYSYYVNNIGKISVAEMNALAARLITDQNRTILIEANDSEKGNLPNEQTVLKWIADAGSNLTPYVDDSAMPFMDKTPAPGKVTDIKVDSTLLVVNLTLANGAKVILKPTTFAQNQILIAAYAFGGTSLAADQDFTSANLAGQVVGNSGVASFTQAQLGKMIGDKNFALTPYIGDITQGISGYASSDNFEPAMQLLNLYFTAPRKDPQVWQSYIDAAKSAITRTANNPGMVYQDTSMAVLGGYNQRSMPATADKLSAASLDKAFDFYKARFADASNFTFTITGDFTVKDIIPYVATYLGSLPSTHSNETFKNLGIHPLAGQITKTVNKGASDKSTVQLVFNGTYEYNDADNLQMDALEEILNIRLVDSLKDGTGIYSPSVRASYVKNPEGRYKLTIGFLADANNTDKAIAYVLAEVNKIKQNGPLASDTKLFVDREARAAQSQYKQNAYWQAALTAAAQNQQDPDKILSRMQALEQVNSQMLKDAANKYLNSNNLIKLILLPEKK